jgi:hypothetical protein
VGSPSELVEAHAFERRRLVTALVSGSPRAGEEDRRGPVRTVAVGLALAVLLAAGAVVARLLAPGPPDDWTSRGLVVSEDTGQAFVIVPEVRTRARTPSFGRSPTSRRHGWSSGEMSSRRWSRRI